ncbi:hypothetical protein M9Y10_014493 [Tritrichomonas musculus]|uniref:Ubiquitin-like domain-containing protein n=1 Tax=Tritrichomonas musculus TaxID=1915356 RepID=A0ABR2L2W3_9EUKA
MKINFEVADPKFSGNFDINIEECKVVEDFKSLFANSLHLNFNQFTITNLPSQLNLINEKYIFKLEITNRCNNITFHFPNGKKYNIPNCYQMSLSEVIAYFQNFDIYYSNQYIKNNLSILISGKEILKIDKPFFAVSEGSKVEVKHRGKTIELEYEDKLFILEEDERANFAYQLFYDSFHSAIRFNLISIQKEESNEKIRSNYKLKSDENYNIKIEHVFKFRNITDQKEQIKFNLSYLATVSEAKQKLSEYFIEAKKIEPEDILIYNCNQKTIAECGMQLKDIRNFNECIYFSANLKNVDQTHSIKFESKNNEPKNTEVQGNSSIKTETQENASKSTENQEKSSGNNENLKNASKNTEKQGKSSRNIESQANASKSTANREKLSGNNKSLENTSENTEVQGKSSIKTETQENASKSAENQEKSSGSNGSTLIDTENQEKSSKDTAIQEKSTGSTENKGDVDSDLQQTKNDLFSASSRKLKASNNSEESNEQENQEQKQTNQKSNANKKIKRRIKSYMPKKVPVDFSLSTEKVYINRSKSRQKQANSKETKSSLEKLPESPAGDDPLIAYKYQTNRSDDICEVKLRESGKVGEMKELISKKNDVPNINNIKILFAGKNLVDDLVVSDLEVGEATLFVYIRSEEDIFLMTANALKVHPNNSGDEYEYEYQYEEDEED